jgi:hypothetical protein
MFCSEDFIDSRDTFKANRRSLHYATPDFLWSLVASVNSVRLSLTKAAYAFASSAAWQEIRVRSGRDDNSVGLPALVINNEPWHRNRIVISTGA